MIKIRLTEDEERYAEDIGKRRNKAFDDTGSGLDPIKGTGGERGHILGFKCEVAAAKALNTEAPENVFTKEQFYNRRQIYDLTNNIEVRGTEYFTGKLIIRPEDKDKAPFVLVIRNPSNNEYTVCGWIYGHEGKQEKYVGAGQYGAKLFFVPQGNLRPIEDLKQIVGTKE